MVNQGVIDETKVALPVQYPEVVCFGNSSLWWRGATSLGIRSAISRGVERIRAKVEREFSLENIAKKYVELYRQIMGP